MNIRKTIPICVLLLLYALAIATGIVWYFEITAHTNFTDIATPVLALSFWIAFPVGGIIAWLAGRKEDWATWQKCAIALAVLPLSVPWAFASFAALALLSFALD
jgi:hypothetical protein